MEFVQVDVMKRAGVSAITIDDVGVIVSILSAPCVLWREDPRELKFWLSELRSPKLRRECRKLALQENHPVRVKWNKSCRKWRKSIRKNTES